MTFSILEAQPKEYATYKLGVQGWFVVAAQIALNSHYKTPPLVLDGICGPATEKAIKDVQLALRITQDGIAGPETQEAFVKAKCKHAEEHVTPPGLLAGLCNIESSYSWCCVSPVNSNGTHDYGPTQESLLNPSESQLRAAFNPDAAAHMLAGEVAGFHRAVKGLVNDREAWRLAALNHNWPSAAWSIATGNSSWLSKPAGWLTEKGYANGFAYCAHYMDVATAQVTDWSVV